MTLADLDEDGDYDAIMNGYWLECPDDPREGEWRSHVIDEQWFTDVTGGWQDHSVRIAVGDVDRDTRPDVAFSHSSWEDPPIRGTGDHQGAPGRAARRRWMEAPSSPPS